MIAAGSLTPSAIQAAEATPAAPQEVLHFNQLGGVAGWQAGGDTVVFVKNRAAQWFEAKMVEACMALDTKKGIKFITDTDPETRVRISKVVVNRHICRVTSLTKVDAPPAAPAAAAKK